MEDVNVWGVFSEELNKIFIFGENIPDKKVKYAFKHENAHASMNKLFPKGKRDTKFEEQYNAFKNNVVGIGQSNFIRNTYRRRNAY